VLRQTDAQRPTAAGRLNARLSVVPHRAAISLRAQLGTLVKQALMPQHFRMERLAVLRGPPGQMNGEGCPVFLRRDNSNGAIMRLDDLVGDIQSQT
jgi:hypothetical protein